MLLQVKWHNNSLFSSHWRALAAVYCQRLKRDNSVLREKHCWKFSLSAKFLSRSMSFSFCLVFLRRLRELVCTLKDMLLSECLLVFISNREWLGFCIYNACSLWGCYRCHWETPYQSLLVDIHTNIIVLPSRQYILSGVCNILANYGFSQQCGLTQPHLVSS